MWQLELEEKEESYLKGIFFLRDKKVSQAKCYRPKADNRHPGVGVKVKLHFRRKRNREFDSQLRVSQRNKGWVAWVVSRSTVNREHTVTVSRKNINSSTIYYS